LHVIFSAQFCFNHAVHSTSSRGLPRDVPTAPSDPTTPDVSAANDDSTATNDDPTAPSDPTTPDDSAATATGAGDDGPDQILANEAGICEP